MMIAGSGPAADEPLLQVAGIHAYYGRIQALHGITLEVRRNEIVTLIGSNGAGKSTTLKAICGMLHPREGSVRFEGRDISRTPAHHLVRSGMCHVPEGRRIFPRLTVLENLQMGAFSQPKDSFKTNLEYVFGVFPRLQERSAQRGGSLSGGEQQMLAIGRALMANPRLLLLDEPSLGLSPILVQQIFAIIREINERGATILLALAIAHRGYVLQTGRVVLSGSSAELRDNDTVRKTYLGIE
jgi:branched-chain amino acid transport system ATP-binding protein